MKAVVREATTADAAAIAAIGRASFPLAHDGVLAPVIIDRVVREVYTVDAVRRSVRDCAADPAAHFLVAADGGEVIGFLHYDTVGPRPELHRIYVAPDRLRGGIGALLLDELDRRLPPTITYVLMVAAGNRSAVAFYERHGFQREAELDGLAHYREQMGVDFPADVGPVPSLLLRRTPD